MGKKSTVVNLERANSDFWPSKWLIGLRHDLKSSIASFWPNGVTQNIPQCHLIDSWFFSQLIKSQLYTKKLNFDFLVKIKCQRSQFIKTCQNMKLIHQEIKKSRFHFEKSKFLNLEIFLSVGNFMFFQNFEQIFHHDARWFKRNFQHESCRYPVYIQHFFSQFLLNMLGSQVVNSWSHDIFI